MPVLSSIFLVEFPQFCGRSCPGGTFGVQGCQYSSGRCPILLSRFLSGESAKGALFAAQKLFSTILKLGSTANPKLSACGGSDSWICGRYASLRIVSEKILTRAQSFLSHFLVKYSGNHFDTSGLKGFEQQPVPTCPTNGRKEGHARRRERMDRRLPSNKLILSEEICSF